MKAHGIQRIKNETKISDDVFDLFALVKFQSSDHGVGDPTAHKSFFQDSGLGIRPIKDGKIIVRNGRFCHLSSNGVGDKASFIPFILGDIQSDLFPRPVFCPEVLWLTVLIILYDCVGRRQNRFCRTIILLQPNNRRLRIISLKIHDVTHISAPPAVNGLIGVSYDAKVVMAVGQKSCQFVLGTVCVLILVD